jgi:hypothetical protein
MVILILPLVFKILILPPAVASSQGGGSTKTKTHMVIWIE